MLSVAVALFAMVSVALLWKGRVSGPCSGMETEEVPLPHAESSMVSLAEAYPQDALIQFSDARDNKDALRQWLATASVAGSAAQELPTDAGVAAKTQQVVEEAMHVKDPAEARGMVRRAMRRGVVRTQAKRRELNKYIKQQRRGLKKNNQFSKSPAELGPGQQTAIAQCVFNVLEIADSVVAIAANLNDASKTCKYVKLKEIIGITTPGGSVANTTHARVCSVNIAAAFAGLASLATSLATAVDGCATTLVPNVDALCSASVTGLVTATSGLAGVGTLIAASCSEHGWYSRVPPGLVPSNVGSNYWIDHPEALDAIRKAPAGEAAASPRKLGEKAGDGRASADHDTHGAAPARQLLFGGGKGSTTTLCTVEILDVAWALADAALAINGAANKDSASCPPAGVVNGDKKSFIYRVSQGLCTIDIAGALQALLGIITTLQLAYVNCADELSLPAICGSGINGIFVVLAALAKIGPGMWLTCDETQMPILKKLLKVAEGLDYKTDGMLTGFLAGDTEGSAVGRRLFETADFDPYTRINALKRRYSSLEEAFRSAGYDLDDKSTKEREMPVRRPALAEIRSLVEEQSSRQQGSVQHGLFGSLQTCS
jgi:hypothetical protein